MADLDAIVIADSPHAGEKLLGLTLAERGRRVAGKLGARRTFVVDSATAAAALAAWDDARGDAALLVLRAGDQVVHMPLAQPLIAGTGERRIAVGPDGAYAGAAVATGAAAKQLVAAIAADSANGDRTCVAAWTDAEKHVHGEIAAHPATTPAERRGGARMLLKLLVKKTEDSPISKYIYRPLSRPLTRLLLRTPVTANQVSYVVAAIGMFGCYLTSRFSQASLIWGAALVFISGIIDGCDGEISRMRLTSSPFGAWLDTVVDEATTLCYFVAVGYHTYLHYPEPWVAGSIAFGATCFLASVYSIYYFCVVVLKAGGSQYYVGTLDIVDGPSGPGLRPRPRAPSTLPPWARKAGTVLMYFVRRDFINLAALGVTFANGFEAIYALMGAGGVITAFVVVPEHLRLRKQLRELARRGGAPRLLAG